jgi:hypothetical protein
MAFRQCELKTIMIAEGVKVIDSFAFSHAKKLETVYFPSTLTELGIALFHQAENLKEIYYNGTSEEFEQRVQLTDDANAYNWFRTYAGRTNANCIFICKDKTIPLGIKL